MGWKFWQGKQSLSVPKPVLSKPKGLPDQIGMFLVVQQNMDPDFVWALKCAMKPRADSATRCDIRLYSPTAARDAGIAVAHYDTLDAHPELILFNGFFDKRSKAFEVRTGSGVPEAVLQPPRVPEAAKRPLRS